MRAPFSFIKGGSAAPTISSLNYTQGDIAGGGQSIVITGTNLSGATNVAIGGNNVTPSASTLATCTFTLPAHAAGPVTVAVTTPGGTSGTLVFTYWSPVQITGIDTYLDANKGVTGGGSVSAWADQSANARNFTQGTGANQPAQTASVFGTMPSIRFTPQQFVSLAAAVNLQASGVSIFAVAKWTATTAVIPPPGNSGNVPLTLVGDRANAYGSFGAAGPAICSNHYTGGPINVLRGGGSGGVATNFNDGTARLIGATYDTTTNVNIYSGASQQGATDVSGALLGTTTYDTVGAGYPASDGWSGDVGAVVISAGVMSGGDITKLNAWSQQRFGTP